MPAEQSDLDLPRLVKELSLFRRADDRRALIELTMTLIPFVGLWIAAAALVNAGVWAGLALDVPAGGLLLRLFLIQHDCGHGSFLQQRQANAFVGRVLGVLTLTPYDFWRSSHAHHHAGTGNLDRRGLGDIDTLTVAEYRQRSSWKRLEYRLYRNPVVLFGIGPAYQFLLRHRVPAGRMQEGWSVWRGVMATNIAIALLFACLIWRFGVSTFMVVQLPVTLIAASSGMWLFYVQHQFPKATWKRDEDWNFHEAALYGSSYYELASPLRWLTANIGVHHVHHLCSTIPFYRMQAVLRAFPHLKLIGRLGVRESVRAVSLSLWDEASGRMVTFGCISSDVANNAK
jgi:omega-6 fatty acid desaturase (delta-12 desaturase)